MSSTDESPEPPLGIDPVASRRIFFGMLALVAGAVLAYAWFRGMQSPPPAAVTRDPLLSAGHRIYDARCAACHGPSGQGDGPVARNLPGPSPVEKLSLTDTTWFHGDRPDQVMAIVAQGIPDSGMRGWNDVLDDREIRAVSAYVYFLAGKPVPGELR
ncbi:MAG: c-type cytochrome [Planctomycetaceae bacterium]|nr:c-type cytochrome [Planctomycetaceae bacterium]